MSITGQLWSAVSGLSQTSQQDKGRRRKALEEVKTGRRVSARSKKKNNWRRIRDVMGTQENLRRAEGKRKTQENDVWQEVEDYMR